MLFSRYLTALARGVDRCLPHENKMSVEILEQRAKETVIASTTVRELRLEQQRLERIQISYLVPHYDVSQGKTLLPLALDPDTVTELNPMGTSDILEDVSPQN